MSAATILTLCNGRGIDLLAPLASDIDFDSYAEQLAKEKRYNGATPGEEYSVAEHLCRGGDAILIRTADEILAAEFLIHDGPEGVLKDDTTPKKHAIAEMIERRCGVLAPKILECFAELTDIHDRAIHEAAGLAWPMPPHIAAEVKRMDLIMFVTEWRDLMGDRPHPNWAPYSGIQPLADRIVPWRWETAKRGLLDRWQRLLPALQARAA